MYKYVNKYLARNSLHSSIGKITIEVDQPCRLDHSCMTVWTCLFVHEQHSPPTAYANIDSICYDQYLCLNLICFDILKTHPIVLHFLFPLDFPYFTVLFPKIWQQQHVINK